MENRLIVIFDGVCSLCEASVLFIINRDKNAKFSFVSAQSKTGSDLQKYYNVNILEEGTLVLIKDKKIYTKSAATIEIAKDLDGAWKLLVLCKLIPKPLRDWVYMKIAINRYKWFGKKKTCMQPSKELKSRFLTD